MTDLSRRQLLASGGLAGASALAATGGYLAAREVAQPRDAASGQASCPGAQREALFALDPDYINLTTFVLASYPRPVREAIERHRRRLDANAALYLRDSEVALEEAARYLRFGPSVLNTVEDVDAAVDAVARVARRSGAGP